MRSRFQWVWHALLSLLGVLVGAIVCVQRWLRCVAAPLCFVLACVLPQVGCTCESAHQAPSNNVAPCISQHERLPRAPPLTTKTVVAGTTPVAYGVTNTGETALSMPMMIPPGRAGVEPSLAVQYNSNGGDGVLGKGFAISGSSAIQRFPKSRAVDGPDAETGRKEFLR